MAAGTMKRRGTFAMAAMASAAAVVVSRSRPRDARRRFHAAEKAGPLTFVNEASQRLNVIHDSAYRFDALFVDFNSGGCPTPSSCRTALGADKPPVEQPLRRHRDVPVRLARRGQLLHRGRAAGVRLGDAPDFNGDGKQVSAAMARRIECGYRSSTNGAFVPRFAAKENGCEDYCAFADITGSGNLEVVTSHAPRPHMAGQQLRRRPATVPTSPSAT